MQEVRTGPAPAVTPRLAMTVAENAKLEIYDYPGEYSQRFDGVDRGGASRSSHRHHGRVVWVASEGGFPGGGLCLHGLPACGNPRCIVFAQNWDSLFQALRSVRQLSIAVEF